MVDEPRPTQVPFTISTSPPPPARIMLRLHCLLRVRMMPPARQDTILSRRQPSLAVPPYCPGCAGSAHEGQHHIPPSRLGSPPTPAPDLLVMRRTKNASSCRPVVAHPPLATVGVPPTVAPSPASHRSQPPGLRPALSRRTLFLAWKRPRPRVVRAAGARYDNVGINERCSPPGDVVCETP